MLMSDCVPYSILLMFCLTPGALGQTRSNETHPTPPVIGMSDSVCTEAPAGDASPSLCVPASTTSERADTHVEAPAMKSFAEPVAKIDLQVPEGTTLRIALDQPTRISHPGNTVHGRIVDTVYAFDQPVIPAGSVATGRIIKVDAVTGTRRALAYANGNFSPFHQYNVTFDTVILPDGQRIAVKTTVSPGTAEVVHLVSNPSNQNQKSVSGRAADKAKQEAKGKIREAEDQLHKSWEDIAAPGRLHRLKRLMLAQSPYRRQYLDPGMRFNADLDQSISFGQIERTAVDLVALGRALAPATALKARLVAEVNSATATRGNRVAAVLTEPLYSPAHQLILPANSRIVGEVVQSKPAHRFHRNGELRLIFERIEIPGEAQRAVAETSQDLSVPGHTGRSRPDHLRPGYSRITGNLEGVEVDRRARMTLDEEGGAHTTDSKTRYLSTGLAILLAAAASHPDGERGTVDSAGDPGVRTAVGGSGFRFTGALISLAAKSSPVSIAFGAYGASASIYTNFLSRGREVVLPKDTPLEIGFGTAHSSANQSKNP